MKLPEEIQNVCDLYLKKIEDDPQHHLTKEFRLAIYQSFGVSEVTQIENSGIKQLFFSPAAKVFGWLAILTARKVMPVWFEQGIVVEPDEYYSSNPVEMLEVAEGLLEGRIEPDNALSDLCERFYYGVTGLQQETKKPVFCGMHTSYTALQVIFDGVDGLKKLNSDFALRALTTYAGIDKNKVGDWWHQQFRPSKDFIPIEFNPAKELEFWKWWLTEAIPQAWEIAHQDSKS